MKSDLAPALKKTDQEAEANQALDRKLPCDQNRDGEWEGFLGADAEMRWERSSQRQDKGAPVEAASCTKAWVTKSVS